MIPKSCTGQNGTLIAGLRLSEWMCSVGTVLTLDLLFQELKCEFIHLFYAT